MLKRLSYLWPYLRRHRKQLVLGLLSILASVVIGMVSPLLVGKAIDTLRLNVSQRTLLGYAALLVNAYSMLSTSACRLASIIFSLTPTVPHSHLPSPLVISTRVLAAVPVAESRMRTL